VSVWISWPLPPNPDLSKFSEPEPVCLKSIWGFKNRLNCHRKWIQSECTSPSLS
jgi:hypothetical protein